MNTNIACSPTILSALKLHIHPYELAYLYKQGTAFFNMRLHIANSKNSKR